MSNLKIIFLQASQSLRDIRIKYLIEFQIWLLIVLFLVIHIQELHETLTTTNKVVLAGEVRGPEIKKEDLIEKVRNCSKRYWL